MSVDPVCFYERQCINTYPPPPPLYYGWLIFGVLISVQSCLLFFFFYTTIIHMNLILIPFYICLFNLALCIGLHNFK